MLVGDLGVTKILFRVTNILRILGQNPVKVRTTENSGETRCARTRLLQSSITRHAFVVVMVVVDAIAERKRLVLGLFDVIVKELEAVVCPSVRHNTPTTVRSAISCVIRRPSFFVSCVLDDTALLPLNGICLFVLQ